VFETLLLAASIWITPAAPSNVPAPIAAGTFVGLDTWVRPEDWSIPVYFASAKDARHPLLYNPNAWGKVASGAWRRWGNSPAVEAEILASSTPVFPYRGNTYSSTSAVTWQLPADFNAVVNPPEGAATFYMRTAMKPAPGWDGHMAVRQPDGGVLETYGTIRLASGTTVALSYSVSDPRRMADGYENGQTASMIPCYAGLLDDKSVNKGSIDHAMAITVPAALLSPKVAYPAYAFDRGALTESPPYSGTLPMGGRLALPASTDLDALGMASPEGRTIAAAAKRYGFVVVDRGGSGISLRVRRNTPSPNARLRTWNNELQQDLQKIFSLLYVVPPTADSGAAAKAAGKP
jgi:hypothetical protein